MEDKKSVEFKTSAAETDGPLPSSSRHTWKHTFSPLQLRLLSAFWILFGLVVLLISVSTNNWIGDGRVSVGLWGPCMESKCVLSALNVEMKKEIIRATGSLLAAASVFASLSFLLISISFCRHRIGAFSLGRIAAVASYIASLFVSIAMSLYTRELNQMEDLVLEAEWSFDAGWVSFPALFLAGSVTLVLSFVEN